VEKEDIGEYEAFKVSTADSAYTLLPMTAFIHTSPYWHLHLQSFYYSHIEVFKFHT
jgi:hypothetical protein